MSRPIAAILFYYPQAVTDEMGPTEVLRGITPQHPVLAEQPHGLDRLRVEAVDRRDRMPVPPQHLAHRTTQVLPVGLHGLHDQRIATRFVDPLVEVDVCQQGRVRVAGGGNLPAELNDGIAGRNLFLGCSLGGQGSRQGLER